MSSEGGAVDARNEEAGLRRSIWSTVVERDVDLCLVDLLHTSVPFRDWLLNGTVDDLVPRDERPTFLGAWHSVSSPNGESDVEAEWLLADGGRLVLLIEDKIGAAFQPEQGQRYRDRANGYVASGRARCTRTVLVAPAAYVHRDPAGAAPFERQLSLESVRDWVQAGECGNRAKHPADFLSQAIRRFEMPRGVRGEGPSTSAMKPQFPETYALLRSLLGDGVSPIPGLCLTNGTPGEWVYFGFDGKGPSISIRWRLRDHWAELVVSRRRVSREALECHRTLKCGH